MKMNLQKGLLLIVFFLHQITLSQTNIFIRPTVGFSVVKANTNALNQVNELILNKSPESYFVNRYNAIPIINSLHKNNLAKIPPFTEYKKKEKAAQDIELKKNYSNFSNHYASLFKEMVSNIFEFNGEKFSYSKVIELAKYTASNNQDGIVSNTLDKTKIYYDISEELLNKIYIITAVPRNVETYEQYSRRKDPTSPVNRYGYHCDFDVYVTKLAWTQEKSNDFFANCWVDDNTNEKDKYPKLENFKNLKFSHELVFMDRLSINASNSVAYRNHPKHGRTMQELYDYMLEVLYGSLKPKLAKEVKDFTLTTPLKSAYPHTAEIGKREGTEITERYYALETKIKSNGEKKYKRKGVLRMIDAVDNTSNKSLVSSFQQQGGKKLYPGITLMEKPHSFFNLLIGYNYKFNNDELNLNQYKIQFNLGPIMIGKKSKKLKNRYFGLGLGYSPFSNTKYLKTDTTSSNGAAISIEIPFGREIYFTKRGNLFIYPSFSIGTDGIILLNDEYSEERSELTPWFIRSTIGIGLGMHLGPKFSLLLRPMLSYFLATENFKKLIPRDTLDPVWGYNTSLSSNFYNNISLRIRL